MPKEYTFYDSTVIKTKQKQTKANKERKRGMTGLISHFT